MSCTNVQLNTLLDFLSDHKDLARGLMRSADGRLRAKQLWVEITKLLNSMGGSVKSVQQWQKMWTDKKHITKKNAATLRRKAAGTGGGPPAPELTISELKVLEIMGDGFGEAQTTARVPVFPTTNFNEEVTSYSAEPAFTISQPMNTNSQPQNSMHIHSQSASSSETQSLASNESPLLIQSHIHFQSQLPTHSGSPTQTDRNQEQQEQSINQTSNIEANPSSHPVEQQPSVNQQPSNLNNTTRLRLIPTRRERSLHRQERNIGGPLLELEQDKLSELKHIKVQLFNLTSAIQELTNVIRRK